MAIVYKFNVLKALINAGYNTSVIRKEKLLSESTVQKLRSNEMVAISNIDTICRLLTCQPGDILQYTSDFTDELVAVQYKPVFFDGEPPELLK